MTRTCSLSSLVNHFVWIPHVFISLYAPIALAGMEFARITSIFGGIERQGKSLFCDRQSQHKNRVLRLLTGLQSNFLMKEDKVIPLY